MLKKEHQERLKYSALLTVVVGIGLLHFFTPGHLSFFHDTYRRLSYFPIVLGAIWFGLRGGLSLAVLSSIAFIPHLLLYVGHGTDNYISELTEVILYLAAGTVTGAIASREARLREQYRVLSEKLERSYARLHEETTLLIEVEEELSASQRLSALGQLSASLAHEIKNPLSSIKGTAEILLDEFPENHPKREFGEILVKEVNRLNETVNEVLKYSKGQMVPAGEVESESLAQVVSRVNKLLENRLRAKAITLEISGLDAARNFEVDGAKLAQVFLNIILNAIDSLESGGRIRISFDPVGDDMTISVADNGPGVAVTEREKIFRPFYSSREEGTGLGLSITAKIIASFGGTIAVKDSELGGASFDIFLPPLAKFSKMDPLARDLPQASS